MKIGITGINGLLGKSTRLFLTGNGYDVFSLDHLTKDDRFIIQKIDDIECNSLDWVIHFASKTSIDTSWKNPFEIYSNNLNSTLIALKIAKQSKAALLYMVSQSIIR